MGTGRTLKRIFPELEVVRMSGACADALRRRGPRAGLRREGVAFQEQLIRIPRLSSPPSFIIETLLHSCLEDVSETK